jgi:hypothetical protein
MTALCWRDLYLNKTKLNMAKAKLKTEKTTSGVKDFLNTVKEDQKREECFTILELMQKATGEEPKMWGTSIIGFGDLTYKYESGREGAWFKIGFSPRKQNFSLYGLNSEFKGEVLKKLGKCSASKGCLYFNHLKDIDLEALEKIIVQANKWFDIQTDKGSKPLSHTFAINQ